MLYEQAVFSGMLTLLAPTASSWRLWAVGAWTVAVVLVRWFVTTEPADPKTLAVLLSPAILFFLPRHRVGAKDSPASHSRSASLGPVAFLFLVLYTFANWYLKSYPYYGNRGLIFAWQCFVAFGLGALVLARDAWTRWLAPSLVAAAGIASGYVLLEHFGYVPGADRGFPPEVTGLIGHKNTYGFVVMVTLVWTVSTIVDRRDAGLPMPVLLFAAALQMVGLVLARSRGSLGLAFGGVGAVTLLTLVRAKRLSQARTRYLIYAAALVACLLPVLLWDEGMWVKVARLFYPPAAAPSLREVYYKAQWNLFLAKPLSGVGLGNFISLNLPYWPVSVRQVAGARIVALNGHCDYLEALSELGLAGFIPFMLLWLGALVLGFRRARRSGEPFHYALVVALLMMMIHATFSTASRHVPAGTLLWLLMGYFWRTPFRQAWARSEGSLKRYTVTGFAALHVIVFALFVRIVAADVFYMRSKKSARGKELTAGETLQRALAIFPDHPEALHKTAELAAWAGECEFARTCAARLDSVAPNLHPTTYIRGVCALREGAYEQALSYAEATLQRWPKLFPPFVLRVEALAKLGRCPEFERRRAFLRRKLEGMGPKVSSEEEFEEYYHDRVGSVRASLSGPVLRGILAARIEDEHRRHQKRKELAADALSAECTTSAVSSRPPMQKR